MQYLEYPVAERVGRSQKKFPEKIPKIPRRKKDQRSAQILECPVVLR
jgi:hypothetical protein